MKFKDFFKLSSKKNVKKSPLHEFVETIVISGILAAFIIIFVLQSFVVRGQSMDPTLHNGERLFVNKFIYRFSEPKRGDVIVFKPDGAPKDRFIKRVIGLPGDTVVIKDGVVRVNGIPLKEDYTAVLTWPDYGPYYVPADHVFVLGDNRKPNESADSRMRTPVGYVNYKSISGKAFLTYWPLTEIKLLRRPDYDNISNSPSTN